MPVFDYRGTTQAGGVRRGVLAADHPRHARDLLRAEGLLVESVRERDSAGRRLRLPRLGWGSLAVRWGEAAHELATLLAGGVSLLRALDTVAEQSSGEFRRLLLVVRDRVAAGARFAEALSEHPQAFDELSVRIVEVGENAGNLDECLDRLAAFKQRWHTLKDQVAGALIYPAFVLSFGAAATVFLMTYVMPPLLDNLQETLQRLPWPTRVVKAGSDLLLGHGLLIGLVLGLALLLAAIALRTPGGRLVRDRLILRTPLVGPLVTKQTISRTSLILATLLESGIPLAPALDLASQSIRNVVLRRAFEQCSRSLTAGGDLTRGLRETGVIPPLAVQIFAVGQESGQLEQLLARLASDYDRQVQSIVTRLASVLEPVLILLLAVMIGFVLVAIILPILEAGHVVL